MNRIYKVKFDKKQGKFVVVSENTKAAGKVGASSVVYERSVSSRILKPIVVLATLAIGLGLALYYFSMGSSTKTAVEQASNASIENTPKPTELVASSDKASNSTDNTAVASTSADNKETHSDAQSPVLASANADTETTAATSSDADKSAQGATVSGDTSKDVAADTQTDKTQEQSVVASTDTASSSGADGVESTTKLSDNNASIAEDSKADSDNAVLPTVKAKKISIAEIKHQNYKAKHKQLAYKNKHPRYTAKNKHYAKPHASSLAIRNSQFQNSGFDVGDVGMGFAVLKPSAQAIRSIDSNTKYSLNTDNADSSYDTKNIDTVNNNDTTNNYDTNNSTTTVVYPAVMGIKTTGQVSSNVKVPKKGTFIALAPAVKKAAMPVVFTPEQGTLNKSAATEPLSAVVASTPVQDDSSVSKQDNAMPVPTVTAASSQVDSTTLEQPPEVIDTSTVAPSPELEQQRVNKILPVASLAKTVVAPKVAPVSKLSEITEVTSNAGETATKASEGLNTVTTNPDNKLSDQNYISALRDKTKIIPMLGNKQSSQATQSTSGPVAKTTKAHIAKLSSKTGAVSMGKNVGLAALSIGPVITEQSSLTKANQYDPDRPDSIDAKSGSNSAGNQAKGLLRLSAPDMLFPVNNGQTGSAGTPVKIKMLGY